jgi:hypothetical protein
MKIFIIGILLLVIIFALYYASMYFNLDYILKKAIPLKQTTRYTINSKEFDAPSSIRYYYEAWILINANMPTDKEHVLFNRGVNFVVGLKGSTLTIYCESDDATSRGTISSSGVYSPITSTMSFEVTKQFPFQKWAHLVLNVDGRTIDAYVDGKLIRSTTVDKTMKIVSDDSITIGNSYTEGKITRFRRTGGSISPQGVYNSYMIGSGESMSASDYGIKIGFMKNDSVRREIELF